MKHALLLWTALLLTGTAGGQVLAADFDHGYPNYANVLDKHVADGRVDYAALQNDPAELNRFLDAAASIPRATFDDWSDAQQIAFLINLYNADTLKLIIEHYPVEGIRKTDWLTYPWRHKRIRLFGDEVSLSHVENDLLRANYDEPRIHFALVCASISCPPLRSEPFLPKSLGSELDRATRNYMADTTQNRFDADKNTLYLSKIFDWYSEDFGELLSYALRYLPTATVREIGDRKPKIRHSDYDWGLNDQKNAG